MSARSVIINADDLGLWPGIDNGIFSAFTLGAVSDTSVFANSEWLAEIIVRAQTQNMPVGIHLNLTCGRALSEMDLVSGLLDEKGCFKKRTEWPELLPVEQIRREFIRQIEEVILHGIQPSHLDSHHHVHVFYPEIRQITIDLAREYQLPVRAIDAEMRKELRENGLKCSDTFAMDFFGERATTATLMNAVKENPGGVVEIMTHPGFYDTAMPGSYREFRIHEYETLTSTSWRDFLDEKNINLINFTQL